MGWITCVCCQKFRWDFMARTFALIAPVQPISHRVSCSNETIQNAPKHYKSHQFMNLESNGVDRVCSLRKTMMQCRGTNLLHKFNPFCNEFRVVTKHCQMHRNTTKIYQNKSFGSNGVDRVRSLPKIPMRVRGTNFYSNCTSSTYFAPSFMQ